MFKCIKLFNYQNRASSEHVQLLTCSNALMKKGYTKKSLNKAEGELY